MEVLVTTNPQLVMEIMLLILGLHSHVILDTSTLVIKQGLVELQENGQRKIHQDVLRVNKSALLIGFELIGLLIREA